MMRAQFAGMLLLCGRYDAAVHAIDNADRSEDGAHHQRRAMELQR